MAALTEEQTLIRDQAKSWATEQAPVAKFRELRNAGSGGFDASTWESMVELGWTGILVPEAHGGSDLGYLTFGLILEELGRELTVSPLFASALVGASALRLGGSDAQCANYLPKIVDGSEILTLAVDDAPRHAPSQIALTATQTDGGLRLSGTKRFVVEGAQATTFIVAVRTANDGVTLVLVPSSAPGVEVETLSTIDSRGYANVSFNDVEIGSDAVLGGPGEGAALLDGILDRARAGLGAEMLGTGAAAFDMTLDYLKTREQFGRVIGSFQALGHRAAQLFTKLELARSCAEAALQSLDASAEETDVARLASLSQVHVGDFLFNMSNELIQMHGGIGMTDEFDAGLYLKRARSLEPLYGNRAFHRDRYATLRGF
ncbi:MAG: acyl-CoA dehydrogenase family protein [Pseudomonadota bacterium]